MPLLGILLDLGRAEDIKGIILRVIVLISVISVYILALVRLLIILLKGLRLNLVVLRPIIIEFRGSSY